MRISVITTKRSYEELERDGFIENFAGNVCFVKARLCGLSVDEMKEILDLMYGGNADE